MDQRRVTVPVSVGLADRIGLAMPVSMMRIVLVLMFVFHVVMRMVVMMGFLEVQVNSSGHQCGGGGQRERERFGEKEHCDQGANEGCGGKIR